METHEIQRNATRASALVDSLQWIASLIGEEHTQPLHPPDSSPITLGLGMIDIATHLRHQATLINQQLFTILVMGEFKNGKSTLLNAMLGRSALPARHVPTTAIITALIYGRDDSVVVYYSGTREPRHISLEEFRAEFTLTARDAALVERGTALGRFNNVDYAQIAIDHPICALRVRLVDSPGLGEHIQRERVTLSFLQEAQALIVVLNATHPFSLNEREFIDNTLATHGLDNIFFVVNRLNQVSPDDQQVIRVFMEDTLRDLITGRLGPISEMQLHDHLFFVNAHAALTARLSTPMNAPELAASGILPLEQVLDRYLTSSAKTHALFARAIQQTEYAVARAQERIRLREAALEMPIARLREQQRQAERELHVLAQERDRIAQAIVRAGMSLYTDLRSHLFTFVVGLRQSWNTEPPELLNLGRIPAQTLLDAAAGQEQAARTLQQTVDRVTNTYLRAKFKQWADIVDPLIQERSLELYTDTSKRISVWTSQLDDVMQGFAPQDASTRLLVEQPLDQLAGRHAGWLAAEDWTSSLRASLRQSAGIMANFGAFGFQLYEWFTRLLTTLTQWLGEQHNGRGDESHTEAFRRLLGERVTTALARELWDDHVYPSAITDPAALARRIVTQRDPVAALVWSRLDPSQQAALNVAREDSDLRELLATALNLTLDQQELLYTAERFAEVRLRDVTLEQARNGPQPGWRVADINRWLLTEACREGLVEKLPDTLYHTIIYEYRRFAEQTTKPLQQMIDESELEVGRIAGQLDRERSDADQERARLQRLSALLDDQVDRVRQLVA